MALVQPTRDSSSGDSHFGMKLTLLQNASIAHAIHISLQLYFGHLKWSRAIPQQEKNRCSPGMVVEVPPALEQSASTRLKSPRSP